MSLAPDSPPPSAPPVRPPPSTRFGWGKFAALLVWTLLLAAGYALYLGVISLPEHLRPYNPWEPLDVRAQPNLLTPFKLARARSNPALCQSALAQTGMEYEALPDRVTGPGCGFDNAVRIRSAPIRLGGPLTLSCPMALSFVMWERHALQPAALAHFGEPVAAIEHFGSYACRNINSGGGAAAHAPAWQRSRHATADALDVSALVLRSGKRISVLQDFRRPDTQESITPEAEWLNDVQAGACQYFKGVLGPNYNAVHRDHFHFETGGYGMCR